MARGAATRPQRGSPPLVPIALRAFQETFGADSPISAAQQAASRTLREYATITGGATVPISMRSMCEMLGIELRGNFRIMVSQPHATALVLSERTLPARGQLGSLRLINGKPVIAVDCTNFASARVTVAHEVGHFLIHLRNGSLDWGTFGSSASEQEESLAEYIGRLLLLPDVGHDSCVALSTSRAEFCVRIASKAAVSVHAAAARSSDPDQPIQGRTIGAIYWIISRRASEGRPLAERLTPGWHICPAFVPVYRCRAREDSVIARVGDSEEPLRGCAVEDVRIGAFTGSFLVDAFAWGSVKRGTRRVLSLFRDQNKV